ncbi:MAG: hypothetical protein HYS22_01480 [Deltaproteobacteria bacterium]|nr:hypothetical protein [Deltaproteobacteria bacterium]
MSPRPLRLCTISLLLLAFLISCSSGDSEFQSPAPQALIDLGIPLTVYAVTTIEPDKHWDFEFDPQENLYKGRILVPTGSTFDITVVYEGDISSTQRVELEHLVRKNITAVGEEMTVAYVGEESNWEAVYEGTPGLDLDGDGFGNLAEYVYKSDLYSKNSIPQGGPSASATRKDLLTNNSVSLPKPGSSFLESLTGTEEIVVEALSIIPIQEMSVIFPTYGVQVLTPAADILKTKKMTVLVETDRFVVGNDVGTITLKVRIKDKYGLVKETPLTFSAFNKEDTKGPSRVRLDLKKDQEINGPTSFIWELDDPSGLEAVSVRLNGNGVERLLGVADQDSSVTRLLANLSFPVNIPDGSYEVIFSARDSSLKHNAYEERVPIKFRRTSSQVPVISNVRSFGGESFAW